MNMIRPLTAIKILNTKKISLSFVKRTMFTSRVANKAINMNLIRKANSVELRGTPNTETVVNPLRPRVDQNNMSTLVAYKFKGKAAKDLANDSSGKHVHVCKETCVENNCEEMKCDTLCNTFEKRDVLGHNTHKPFKGRFSKFISDLDANGNADPQYFTKTNKEVSKDASELTQYKANNFIVDAPQTTFVNLFRDKYGN